MSRIPHRPRPWQRHEWHHRRRPHHGQVGDDTFTFLGGALGSVALDGGTGTNDTLNDLSLLPAMRTIKNFETQS